MRPSQTMVAGISATDGKTVVSPAVNQYENCLRCHGTSTGKKSSVNFGYLPVRVVAASDPLNVIPEFSSFATSSHPVFHDRTSLFPQPSLRANMLNLDGRTPGAPWAPASCAPTATIATTIGNSAAADPADRTDRFSRTSWSAGMSSARRRFPASSSPICSPTRALSAQGGASGGPYALCAKCHDLNQIMNNTSFSEHARHIKQDGFSCSVCHTAHGMGAQSGTISGERLVNFDAKVVAPNGATPISYNRATNSCSLVCHNHAHQLRTAAGAAKHWHSK